MLPRKRVHPEIKSRLHPRSRHRQRYEFAKLTESCPELALFLGKNAYGDESIDFFNPEAVKALNKALLLHYYGLSYWDIPPGYLCPPVPGRADYIHTIADLLADKHGHQAPAGSSIRGLDIGTGANCIYPIIGLSEYGWSFTASDIDPVAIKSARCIVDQNQVLHNKVELRLQPDPKNIFIGIIRPDEFYDFTICNPPFHTSAAEARAGTVRKLSNLKEKAIKYPVLNFGGRNNELWCPGGEERFVSTMIRESREFAQSCFWFSTLISKESNLRITYKTLSATKAAEVRTLNLGQGNKTSRIVAWTYLDTADQQRWIKSRWKGI